MSSIGPALVTSKLANRAKSKLDEMLIREGRMDLAKRCIQHLPTQAELDLFGWENLFEH